MNKAEYMQILLEQIHNKRAKILIQPEIEAHIEDQMDTYLEYGMSHTEAEERAIKQMGDPITTGNDLNRIHRPKTDPAIFSLLFFLVAIGILMQSIAYLYMKDLSLIGTDRSLGEYIVRTISYNLIGLLVLFAVYLLDYTTILRHVWKLYVLFLVAHAIVSISMNQLRIENSYILSSNVDSIFFSVFILLFACFIYRFQGEGFLGILKCIGICFLTLLVFLTQGTFLRGELLCLACCCGITLLVAISKDIFGRKKWLHFTILVGSFLAIVGYAIGDILFFEGAHIGLQVYQLARLAAYINPSAYSVSYGYIPALIKEQVNGATLIGNHSLSGFGSMAELYTNYLITCLFSYFGFFIGVLVLTLFALFLCRCLHISHFQKNRLGFQLSFSASLLILLNAVIYVCVNLGSAPVISMNMPFFSYGLTNAISNYFLLGIILCVYRNTELLAEPGKYNMRSALLYMKHNKETEM